MNDPHPEPGTPAWYAQVEEPVVDPKREIIDTHHHFWEAEDHSSIGAYGLADLWADTESGHNVLKTVFVQCTAQYLKHGPEHLRPAGETAYVARLAAGSAAGPGDGTHPATVAAIVSHADMRLGGQLGEVLDAHEEAGRGLFRGIRHAAAQEPDPEGSAGGSTDPRILLDPAFQAGVRMLGERGYTYESWHYHTQLKDFLALAQAAPETTIILDHLGGPLQGGWFRNRRGEVLASWRSDIAALARCENVHAKLGGLAQPSIGFDYHTLPRPRTSGELVAEQEQFYLHAIECFGPDRCMFESNFPVDKLSISYRVLWNAFKKMAADFSEAERHAMFYATAERVYRTG